ncbi:MAG: fibronectin type III domain-containing protein [Oscillospiraceae bacterium]|nr:fibronectin type III domain-containing protein [Oscillospiraceae bacterium]
MKKLLSVLLTAIMLTSVFLAVPMSASAKDYEQDSFKDIVLEITGSKGNGLVVGQSAKSPDGIFSVVGTDSTGSEWEIWGNNGISSYWKNSVGDNMGNEAVTERTSYKLHLCITPVLGAGDTGAEDMININEVKSITFNGRQLSTSEYRRGELGTSIYVDVIFYYVDIQGSVGEDQTGYYLIGENIDVTAPAKEGNHFKSWGGTYYTGAGSQSVNFADATAQTTTFEAPYSSMGTTVTPYYEEHNPVDCYVKATTTKDGKIENLCPVCNEVLSAVAIPRVSTVKLSATSYTYDGKVKTPAVTVKDIQGSTLKKDTDYTVSYQSGRKNVGKYAVKVTLMGNYSGTKTMYFAINPKSTTISKLTPGSKKMTVKWKKQATQTTGYEIQYSQSSKFTKSKIATVKKNTATSTTIKKLSAKKKYYARIRTYKTVKVNGKATKLYSSWSKAKSVTVKK